jgi:hypothetical protein
MPRVPANFSPIDPTEQIDLTFDFSAALGPGETISTTHWTMGVESGTDAAASTRLVGTPTTDGYRSTCRVGTCQAGVSYQPRAEVTTSFGQILSAYSTLPCSTPKS